MATKSIGATGRDYATLALWAAYVNALSLSAAEIGEMYNDSGFTVSAKVTLGGWTGGSSTNTVTLRCNAGQSFRDNASVQSNALRYNQSNGVGVACSVSYDTSVLVTTPFFNMDGIQFKASNNTIQMFRINTTSGNTCGITNCIFAGTAGANNWLAAATSSRADWTNCLVIANSSTTRGLKCETANGTTASTVTDCTIVAVNGASSNGLTTQYTPALIAKNTVVAGFGANDYVGTAGASSTNNATDQASFGGTNFGGSGQTSLTAATEWTSVTNGSEDLRLASGSVKLKDNGATVGPTNDIAGTTRPQGSAYDIGCWELIVSVSETVGEMVASQMMGTSWLLRRGIGVISY